MNPKEKKQTPGSSQNVQAPQDENPMSSPKKPNTLSSTKTLNDPVEIKRRRDQRLQRNFNHNR
jgi:hypothetical protein